MPIKHQPKTINSSPTTTHTRRDIEYKATPRHCFNPGRIPRADQVYSTLPLPITTVITQASTSTKSSGSATEIRSCKSGRASSLITTPFTRQLAETGLRSIGTSWILFWDQFTSSIAMTRCSTAYRMAPRNSKAGISMRSMQITLDGSAKLRRRD